MRPQLTKYLNYFVFLLYLLHCSGKKIWLPNRCEHQIYQFLTFHSDIFKNGTRDLTRTNDSMRSEGWPRGSAHSPCARQLPSTSQTAETFVQDCFRDSNGKIWFTELTTEDFRTCKSSSLLGTVLIAGPTPLLIPFPCSDRGSSCDIKYGFMLCIKDGRQGHNTLMMIWKPLPNLDFICWGPPYWWQRLVSNTNQIFPALSRISGIV